MSENYLLSHVFGHNFQIQPFPRSYSPYNLESWSMRYVGSAARVQSTYGLYTNNYGLYTNNIPTIIQSSGQIIILH